MGQKKSKNSLSFDLNDIMSKDLVLLSLVDLNHVDKNDIKDFLMAKSLHFLREKAKEEVY